MSARQASAHTKVRALRSNPTDDQVAGCATDQDPWFAPSLLDWFQRHGRHDLPWQHPRDAYRVWIAELMLQQTQVQVVIPYFLRFIERFPTLKALADASLDHVMTHWAGLGYYARARNAHRAARHCLAHYQAELPRQYEALSALPGIGRSTAGAILAQAWNQRYPILDGNVKRLLSRLFGIVGYPGKAAVQRALWAKATALVDQPAGHLIADYTQAQMDFGATVCTRHRPACPSCPMKAHCVAYQEDRVTTLPTPKPSKVIPERSAWAVVIQNSDGDILLKRRPATGIWAGLWTLPQEENQAALRQWTAKHLCHGHWSAAKRFSRLTHTFSHFRLDLEVWHLPCQGLRTDLTHASDFRWVKPCQTTDLGLPAPIQKLFLHLCQAHQHDLELTAHDFLPV